MAQATDHHGAVAAHKTWCIDQQSRSHNLLVNRILAMERKLELHISEGHHQSRAFSSLSSVPLAARNQGGHDWDFLGQPGAGHPVGGGQEEEDLFLPAHGGDQAPAPGRLFDGAVPGSQGKRSTIYQMQ